MAAKRWQDWGNAILGLWMAVSPWVLAFSTSTGGAARAAWILGAAIVVLAGVALYIPGDPSGPVGPVAQHAGPEGVARAVLPAAENVN